MNILKIEDIHSVELGSTLLRFLKNSLDEVNLSVNGSVTPVEFYYEVPDGYDFLWHNITIQLSDNSQLIADCFGASFKLANGIRVYTKSPEDLIPFDLLDGQTIKTNTELAAFSDTAATELGSGNGIVSTLNLSNLSMGYMPRLKPGHKIVALVQDDLRDITTIKISIGGMLVSRKNRP